jgi:hypothetical protein
MFKNLYFSKLYSILCPILQAVHNFINVSLFLSIFVKKFSRKYENFRFNPIAKLNSNITSHMFILSSHACGITANSVFFFSFAKTA